MGMMKLKIGDLCVSDEVLPRASNEQEVIDHYAEVLRKYEMPPLVVFYDGAVNWLADGRYRLKAHRKIGQETVKCDVRKGTKEDAIWHACGANSKHGLPLSGKEKRAAVELLLGTEAAAKATNEKIADHVGCSSALVTRVLEQRKKAAEAAGKKVEPRVVEQVRGDKVVEVDVTNTGRAKKPGAGRPNKKQRAFKAQKEKKKYAKDGVGQRIPDFLEQVALDSLRLATYQDVATKLAHDLAEFRNMPSGPGAYLATEEIVPLLLEVRKLLIAAEFHACCTECVDRKGLAASCSCGGVGWFGRAAYAMHHQVEPK